MVSPEGRARLRRLPPWAASMAGSPRQRFAKVTPYRSRLPVDLHRQFHRRRRRQDADGHRHRRPAQAAWAAGPPSSPAAMAARARGRSWSSRATARRRSAMSRCCWRKPRRPWFRPTAPAGAKAIEASDASVIVMDDGFQNPSLAKDLSLVVVDGGRGRRQRPGHPGGPARERRSMRRSRAPRR